MTNTPEPTVWPVLHYDDTGAALRFLVDAFGFREASRMTWTRSIGVRFG